MDVPGRADAFRHDDLEQTVLRCGVVLADLDRLEHPEQPERLAFVGVQRVSGLGPLLRDGAHVPHSFLNVCYALQLSINEQLQSELSQYGHSLSSPSAERLRCWRLLFESAMALLDVLDGEL